MPFSNLRIFHRAVLDYRRHDRQLLVTPSLAQAGRKGHRSVGTFQIPGVAHDLRFVVAGAGGCHNIYSYWFYFLMQI
nr:MAG TPA: hypothetical protein [Caudoviricetes sp.]